MLAELLPNAPRSHCIMRKQLYGKQRLNVEGLCVANKWVYFINCVGIYGK